MLTNKIEEYFSNHCTEKRYETKKSLAENYLRINISNLKDSINVDIYKTGSIVIGGKKTELKNEFEKIKKQIDENPEILTGIIYSPKALSQSYIILNDEVRKKIKDSLFEIDESVKLNEEPTPSEMYRAKLSKSEYYISITQYHTGTLLLQGKEDILFSNACDHIEKIAVPSPKEVITRFICGDEEALKAFTIKYTPEILILAETNIKEKLGDAFNFLEVHDQKWLLTSEIFKIANLPLPEYSPIVMPAAKAFEGFIKKILVAVGFYRADHFKSKNATFAYLNDLTDPVRKAFCLKERIVDTVLKDIIVSLDKYRNFILHSDNNINTKVESYEEAVKLLEEINDKIIYFYEYFKRNTVFGL